MSHLENLQDTISQLQTQSTTLNSLTEVYAKVEKTEENQENETTFLNTDNFENLPLLVSHERLI